MTPEETARRISRLADVNHDALRLARYVSFASVVEPALLRAARYAFVPRADAGAEADVWFSGLVQARSPHGIVLFAEVADSLRRGLTTRDAKAAFELTSRLHGPRARALRIEEEVNYLSLEPEANRGRIETLLASAAAALVNGGRADIANWAGRAVPRFPAAVQKLDAAAMLAVASELRLGRGSTLRTHLEGRDALPRWFAQVAPSTTPVEIGVSVTDAGVVFGPPARDTPIVRAPATTPIVLELGWTDAAGAHSRLVFLEPGQRAAAERLPASQVSVTTLAGDVYTLAAGAGPTPAALENAVTLRAYPGAYRVLLKWFAPRPIPQCIGFAVERRTRDGRVETLARTDPLAAGEEARRRSMSEAPLQAFTWSDEGDRAAASHVSSSADASMWPAQYRVVPVVIEKSRPVLLASQASNWSERVQPGPAAGGPVSAQFNRAFAFWGTGPDLFADNTDVPPELWQANLDEAVARSTRAYLGGDLLAGLLATIERARTQAGEVFVAISGIGQRQIVDALAGLGRRAHVLMPPVDARRRKYDEADAIGLLERAGVDVKRRALPPNLPSNSKFVVACDAQARPIAVWTGNASWTTVGLCARENLALSIENPVIAAAFLSYWRLLDTTAAQPGFQRELARANTDPATARTQGGELRVWFAPSRTAPELDVVRDAIAGAKDGVLFVVSELPLFDDLMRTIDRAQRRGVYVAGVLTRGLNAAVFDNGRQTNMTAATALNPSITLAMRALQEASGPVRPPQMRAIVIDPLGHGPIVFAGSTSLGERSARATDSNLVMVRGDRQLAIQCAATLEQIVRYYANRLSAARKKPGASGVSARGDGSWQLGYYTSEARRRGMQFWTGVKAEAPGRRRGRL